MAINLTILAFLTMVTTIEIYIYQSQLVASDWLNEGCVGVVVYDIIIRRQQMLQISNLESKLKFMTSDDMALCCEVSCSRLEVK